MVGAHQHTTNQVRKCTSGYKERLKRGEVARQSGLRAHRRPVVVEEVAQRQQVWSSINSGANCYRMGER
jgi:hypothetical protein